MGRDFTQSQAAAQAQKKTGNGERRAGRGSAARVALERLQGRPWDDGEVWSIPLTGRDCLGPV